MAARNEMEKLLPPELMQSWSVLQWSHSETLAGAEVLVHRDIAAASTFHRNFETNRLAYNLILRRSRPFPLPEVVGVLGGIHLCFFV